MRTIQDMVQQEVLCYMSGIVHTLAKCDGMQASAIDAAPDAWALFNQAIELAAPVEDYEEAAIQAGFAPSKTAPGEWSNEGAIFKPGEEPMFWDSAEQACGEQDIEPYQREVFEHWAVTDWLADKLIEQGEKVDKDFGSLCIWARTTTGQAIHADSIIEKIYAEMMVA